MDTASFAPLIVERLRKGVGTEESVSLHEPWLSGNEARYVVDCIETGWVSSVGRYVDQFEKQLKDYTGARSAVAVANGTAALQVALRLVGVKAGDEVLMPSLTFVATPNAASYLGAIPHFVDVDETSLGVDPILLRQHLESISVRDSGSLLNKKTGRPIRAFVVMHTFGHPADLKPLLSICEEFGIELVEDAAESLGSLYEGRHVGTFGRVAALSFNGNKIVTTGGGGAVLTNDEELGRLAKHLTTTAKVAHPWEFAHDQIGYNFRLPNINAALGCAQLERLPEFVSLKRDLHERYAEFFADVSGVRLFCEQKFAKSNYWLNALVLDRADETLLRALLESTNAAGLMTRPLWKLMHRLPMYDACPRADLAVSEQLASRILSIPSSARLGRVVHV